MPAVVVPTQPAPASRSRIAGAPLPTTEGGQLEKALPHNLSEKERAVELAVQQQRLAEMNQELETATEQAEQEAKARALEGDVNVDAQQEKGPEGL